VACRADDSPVFRRSPARRENACDACRPAAGPAPIGRVRGAKLGCERFLSGIRGAGRRALQARHPHRHHADWRTPGDPFRRPSTGLSTTGLLRHETSDANSVDWIDAVGSGRNLIVASNDQVPNVEFSTPRGAVRRCRGTGSGFSRSAGLRRATAGSALRRAVATSRFARTGAAAHSGPVAGRAWFSGVLDGAVRILCRRSRKKRKGPDEVKRARSQPCLLQSAARERLGFCACASTQRHGCAWRHSNAPAFPLADLPQILE